MNWNFCVPSIVASKHTLSQEMVKIWKDAIWTVKQAQQKFQAAYQSTLDTMVPGWRETWKTDPAFHAKIAELEDLMRELCLKNGMQLTTFNRYRRAARKVALLNVPFNLAGERYSVSDLAAISTSEDITKAAREMRKEKCLKSAASQVARVATILPMPVKGDHAEDYFKLLREKLAAHLASVKEVLGEDAVKEFALIL